MSGSSGNVLDAIAHPAQLNVLGAYQGAAQTADAIYGVQQKQGQQLWGQALQQATDANGNVDYAKANLIASRMGPAAASAAATNLANNATIRGQQINNAAGIYKLTGIAALNVAKNPTDEGVNSAFDNMIASGLSATEVNAERQRVLGMSQPDRQNYAVQHGLSVLEQLHQVIGQTTGQNVGDKISPVTITQPSGTGAPGGLTVGQGGVTLGLTPEQFAQPHTWTDETGQTHQGTVGTYLQTLGIQPPAGGQQTGGGATTPPGVPPPGTIPPNPNAPAGTPAGRITPPPALTNPNKPATTPPTVQTTAPQAPVVTPPAAAPAAPAAGANIPGAPPGTSEDLAAYKADQAAVPTQVTRMQNMQHAYDALSQLKSATGKGAQGINDLRSYAQTLGILPAGAVTEQQLYEVINKYTERAMLDAAGGTGTDLARQMQSQANPNTGLSTPANLELLRNDLGTAMQKTAASALQDPTTSGVGYLKARGDLARNTDPRGFVWGFYSPVEQAKILAEVKGTPADEKLHRAIGMSLDPKLQIPQVRPPAAQQKQSFNVQPPAPVQNLLQMTG